MIWGMFMTVTMESAVFLAKNYLNNCQSIANTTDLTLKQMFDISSRFVSEQEGISGLETIGWENHSWFGIRGKWMSNFPCCKSIVQRSTQKQRTWKIVDTLCSRFGND